MYLPATVLNHLPYSTILWLLQINSRACHVLASSGYPLSVRDWRLPYPRIFLGNYTEAEFAEVQRITPSFVHWELARPVVGMNPLSVSLFLAALQRGEVGTPFEAYQRMRHEYNAKALRIFEAATTEGFKQVLHNVFNLFFHLPVENISAYVDIADSGLVLLSTVSDHLTFINSLAAEAVWQQMHARMTGRPTADVTLEALAKSVCHSVILSVDGLMLF